jgi:glutamate-ammonia-ligase adenylyltransferase
MIDIEFAVQYLALGQSDRHPELTRNAGNIALLKLAGELDLIPVESAESVGDAYREYRRRQHWLRLNGAKYARVPAQEIASRIDATRLLWTRVFETA